MAHARTIDVIWAQLASEKIRAAGLPVEQILRKAGIKSYILNQETARIPFRRHADLFELAAAATENGCFGLDLAAQEGDPRDIGLLVYAAMSSNNLGEALKVVQRYFHVFNEAAVVETVISGNRATVEFEFSEPRAGSLRQATEFAAARMVRIFQFLAGTLLLRPVEVTFAHMRHHGIEEFKRFFGCPVRFGAGLNSLTFETSQLALPIATADHRLLRILTRYCEEILASREQVVSLGVV
jgi:AraC-type transcriptional regulator